MIELRWVDGTEPAPEFGKSIVRNVKVLQYRQFVLGTDASGALTPCGSWGWSEWQDVPYVKEPT